MGLSQALFPVLPEGKCFGKEDASAQHPTTYLVSVTVCIVHWPASVTPLLSLLGLFDHLIPLNPFFSQLSFHSSLTFFKTTDGEKRAFALIHCLFERNINSHKTALPLTLKQSILLNMTRIQKNTSANTSIMLESCIKNSHTCMHRESS